MSEINDELPEGFSREQVTELLERWDTALEALELAHYIRNEPGIADEMPAVEAWLITTDYHEVFGEGKAASLDRSPKKNWVEKAGGLPSYIRRIAVHLIEKGMSIGHAIAVAVNAAKKMCATGDVNWPGHQNVNPGSRAEACAAVADWERKKAQS